MDYGHWLFNVEFSPSDWFGFIYKITELDTGREYIGKKQFFNTTRKIIKGRKNRKKIISESNWRVYTGSSDNLNASIELKGKNNYKFEILSLHSTKGSLHYAEVESQVTENVLREVLTDGKTKKFYNKVISGVKFIPPAKTKEEIKVLICKLISGNEYLPNKLSMSDYDQWNSYNYSHEKCQELYGFEKAILIKKLLFEQTIPSYKTKTHSDETKEKIRKSTTGTRKGKNNSMFGKPCYYNMDPSQISTWKENISKSTKGKPKTEEHKAKISKSKIGKQTVSVTCPHCNKTGRGGNMTRYHFDNCKLKK